MSDFGPGARPGSLRPAVGGQLSAREIHVALLTAEGLTSPQIAASLGIGAGTVRTTRGSIRRKLGITTGDDLRAELRRRFGSQPTVPEPADVPGAGDDKRIHLALRQAITAVDQLGQRLQSRSEAVRQAAGHAGDSEGGLVWEADEIAHLAAGLRALHDRAVAQARNRTG